MSATLTITCDTCTRAFWRADDEQGRRAVPSTTFAHELLTRPSGWALRPKEGTTFPLDKCDGAWRVERVRRPAGRAWRYTCPWCAGTAR